MIYGSMSNENGRLSSKDCADCGLLPPGHFSVDFTRDFQHAFPDTIILKAFCEIERLYCKFLWPIWYHGGFSKFNLGSNFLESVDTLIIRVSNSYNVFTLLCSGYSDLVS